jgi:hypothetical protein
VANSGDLIWQPEHRALLRSHVDQYHSGLAFLPDYIMPEWGVLDTTLADEFIQRAAADRKSLYIQGPLYPDRFDNYTDAQNLPPVTSHISSAEDALDFINLLIDTVGSVLGPQFDGQWEIVNEIVNGHGLKGGVLTELLGPAWITEAFKRARLCCPSAELVWSQDNTEEVGNSAFYQATRYHFRAAVQDALDAGAPIDTISLQGHLIFERGTVDSRFEDEAHWYRSRGLKFRIGEMTARSITRWQDFAYDDEDASDYRARQVEHLKRFLAVALPYCNGGLTFFNLLDVDSTFGDERVGLYDLDLKLKQDFYDAIYEALDQFEPARILPPVEEGLELVVDGEGKPLTNADGSYQVRAKELIPFGTFKEAETLAEVGLIEGDGGRVEWSNAGFSGLADGYIRLTSVSGQTGRGAIAVPLRPDVDYTLNAERAPGSDRDKTSTHLRLSSSLSSTGSIPDFEDLNFTGELDRVSRTGRIPPGVRVGVLLFNSGNVTDGRTSLVDNLSIARSL